MTTTHPSVYELAETVDRLRGKVRPHVGVAIVSVPDTWLHPPCRAPRCQSRPCSPHLSEMATWWTVDPAAFDGIIPGPAYRPEKHFRAHCEAGLESVQEFVHRLPFVAFVGLHVPVRGWEG